jgi:hypothetical protein
MFVAIAKLLLASFCLDCDPLFSRFFWEIFLEELLEFRVDIVYIIHQYYRRLPIGDSFVAYQHLLASQHHLYIAGKNVPSFSVV